MGKDLDQERYQRVLESCALLQDLELLPAGDMSEIGEKGINLSGGQRHRVALARACYAGKDVRVVFSPSEHVCLKWPVSKRHALPEMLHEVDNR